MKKADRIYYGGDYNPDQWDDQTIDEDMRLFKKAGINLLTLPVFSWAKLEPDEGVYNFEWLDRIIDKIWENGIHVCLATPTTAQPAWLSTRYPEVLPVDIAGRKRTHGMRVFFCVNSLKYRERAAAIAEQMAMRYAHHPALAMWHVSNEYGTYCYCPTCQAKFRVWLRKRYGTVDELNKRWHTTFWGRIVSSFEEVTLPTELNDDYRFNPAIQLDYMRFVTDSTAECFQNEYDILKKYNPEIPIQTNMSGFIKKLDQFTMTKKLDIVGWDNYPWPDDPAYFVAMKHDIMRGLKGGQSFVLTEQSPNQQNWQEYNKLKKPGEVRLLAYQGIAHGADSSLYFQMRQSIGGQEKFHGAIISHAGTDDTRIFHEFEQLGSELHQLGGQILDARIKADVGILFDWDNWWALELCSGPTKDMDYLLQVAHYYRAFHKQNIAVDLIKFTSAFDSYKILVAPLVYMIKPGLAERLIQFVNNGGTLIGTYMTGLADETDRCIFGAYPGPLRELFGLWVEETDALYPEEKNQIIMETGEHQTYTCSFLCDRLRLESAKVIGIYGSDFYAGEACVTENTYGKGKAYYLGTQPDEAFLKVFIKNICQEEGVHPILETEDGIEVTCRENENGKFYFILNHNQAEKQVILPEGKWKNLIGKQPEDGKLHLKSRDAAILKYE